MGLIPIASDIKKSDKSSLTVEFHSFFVKSEKGSSSFNLKLAAGFLAFFLDLDLGGVAVVVRVFVLKLDLGGMVHFCPFFSTKLP